MKRALVLTIIGGAFLAPAAADPAGTIYNTFPSPVPIDTVYSWGYEAESTAEFGDLIDVNAGAGNLNSAAVLMSNWAYESMYEPIGTSTGYTADLTLNIYNVGASNAVGTLIASSSTDVFVPWRPEPNPTACSQATAVDDPTNSGNPYLGADSNCYSGQALTAYFSFSNISLPSEVIYGLAYNTEFAGYDPTGEVGPMNSLNFAWTTASPTTGSNPLPDTGYLNSTNASIYADGGDAGTGTFRQDQNYSCANNQICSSPGAFSGVIELSNMSLAPEPGTISTMLIGLALGGLASSRRMRLFRSAGRK